MVIIHFKLLFFLVMTSHLKIASWNVRGLRSKAKQNEIIDYSKEVKIDILLVQETHIDHSKYIKNFDEIFSTKSFWSLSCGRSGGVAIIIFGNARNLPIKMGRDYDGRIVFVDLKLGFRIINIYAPVRSQQQIDFFRSLDDYACDARKLLLAGDFNCVEHEIADRKPPRDRQITYGAKSYIEFKRRTNSVDCWNQKYPGNPVMTWKGGKYEARLDRFIATKT